MGRSGNRRRTKVPENDTPTSYELPILPIKNSVFFPHVAISVSFGRASSLAAIEAALTSDSKMLAVLTQRDATVEEPTLNDLFGIGTVSLIKLIGRFKASMQIILYGVQRVKVAESLQSTPYLKAKLLPAPVLVEEGVEREALQRELMELTSKYLALGHPEVKLNFPPTLAPEDDVMQLVYPLAAHQPRQKQ